MTYQQRRAGKLSVLDAMRRKLPGDGLGWVTPHDSRLSAWRWRDARRWRHRFPPALRPLVWAADRLGWAGIALIDTWQFSRAIGLGAADTARLYLEALACGGRPLDVHVWRSLHHSRHPLPSRSAALLFSGLGQRAGHRLLADKLKLAEHLSTIGIRTPAMRGVLARSFEADRDSDLLADAGVGPGLFLKPRHGHGGRGAFSLTVESDVWSMNGYPGTRASVTARISRLTQTDEVLVQDRLMSIDTLSDLAPGGRAPVLRLVTACTPQGDPFLHSAMLMVARPGKNPSHFLEGQILAPIDLATGRMAGGILLARPGTVMERLWENGPSVKSRDVPSFSQAVEMTLAAMGGLPPLCVIHWDVIVTQDGPVILEGNTAGNWILASLPGLLGHQACPLEDVIAPWTDTTSRGAVGPTTPAARAGRASGEAARLATAPSVTTIKDGESRNSHHSDSFAAECHKN